MVTLASAPSQGSIGSVAHLRTPSATWHNAAIAAIEGSSRREWKQAAGYQRRSLAETLMYRLKVHTGSDDAVTGGSGWPMKAYSLDFTLLRGNGIGERKREPFVGALRPAAASLRIWMGQARLLEDRLIFFRPDDVAILLPNQDERPRSPGNHAVGFQQLGMLQSLSQGHGHVSCLLQLNSDQLVRERGPRGRELHQVEEAVAECKLF